MGCGCLTIIENKNSRNLFIANTINNRMENLPFDISKFRNEALNIHNKLRIKHGSPELILNEELNELAQNYADKIINYEDRKIFPSPIFHDSLLGENILLSKKQNAEYICNKWYTECKDYNYNENKYQERSLHFTQIVWKETSQVGFGFVLNNENFCSVALYYPAGNVLGEFEKNVTKPQ